MLREAFRQRADCSANVRKGPLGRALDIGYAHRYAHPPLLPAQSSSEILLTSGTGAFSDVGTGLGIIVPSSSDLGFGGFEGTLRPPCFAGRKSQALAVCACSGDGPECAHAKLIASSKMLWRWQVPVRSSSETHAGFAKAHNGQPGIREAKSGQEGRSGKWRHHLPEWLAGCCSAGRVASPLFDAVHTYFSMQAHWPP